MPLSNEKLLCIAREVGFRGGERLLRQGEPARGAFVIRTGELEAQVALPCGGILTVAQLRAGDMFGEPLRQRAPARTRPGLGRTQRPMDLVIMRECTEGFYPDRSMHAGSGEFMSTPDIAMSLHSSLHAKGETGHGGAQGERLPSHGRPLPQGHARRGGRFS